MARFIAFLRAINVGGHVVKMERLREIFLGLGLTNVETFIASGNVIFDSTETAPILEKMIADELYRALEYEVATFLRSTAELRALARHQPFGQVKLSPAENVLYLAFVKQRPNREAAARLMTFRNEIDDFHVHGREIYWLRRRANGESLFSGAKLEKLIGLPATVRNLTTVQGLLAKLTS